MGGWRGEEGGLSSLSAPRRPLPFRALCKQCVREDCYHGKVPQGQSQRLSIAASDRFHLEVPASICWLLAEDTEDGKWRKRDHLGREHPLYVHASRRGRKDV